MNHISAPNAGWSNGVEGAFQGRDDFALHRNGFAGNARASSRRMAASTELGGNLIDVHLLTLRAQTDPGQFRFDFFEDTGNHDRGNGADVIDQPFRVAALSARASEVGFFEPKVGDLIFVCEMEMAVNMFQQPGAGQRVGLIDLIADFGQVRTAVDQLARHMITARTCARILKRAGISRNGGEKAISDRFRDWPFGEFEQAEDQFAARGLTRGNPIKISITSIALVMIDVDKHFALRDARADGSQPFETGGVSRNDTIEFQPRLWFLKNLFRIEEFVFLRNAIFIPTEDFFPLVPQSQRQA